MVSRQLLYGRMIDGQILGEITPTECSWSDVANDNGAIQATIAGAEVRRLNLAQEAAAERCFLAFEEENRIRQAGPIHGRRWDWEKQTFDLTAGSFWSYLDRRIIHNPNDGGAPLQTTSLVLSGPDLRSIAKQLLDTIYSQGYFPAVAAAGVDSTPNTITRTWYGYQLANLGEAFREFTKEGLDIRWRPARNVLGDGDSIIHWVFEAGTATSTQLSQNGDDWVFDATAPKSPVRGVTVDEDGSKMSIQGWISGSGSETQTVMAYLFTPAGQALLDAGYPLLDIVDSLPQEQSSSVLGAHLVSLLNASARPVAAWQVAVDAEAALEVRPGDYCQLILEDDPFLGDINTRTRVSRVSGSYVKDTTTLEMYPVAATL